MDGFQKNLNVNVSEEIGVGEIIGDNGQENKEDQINLLELYVKPHKKIARVVTEDDVKTVMKDATNMVKLSRMGRGYYQNAAAIAHPQINDKDPLRFFVLKDGFLIVNPEIIEHTRHTIDSQEGCMSFPSELMITVQRFNKIKVRFQAFITDPNDENKVILSEFREEDLSGKLAKIFQHEIHHLNGVNIYDEDYSPETCANI